MLNKAVISTLDVSTRDKRKQATELAIALLEHIQLAEFVCQLTNSPFLEYGEVYARTERSLGALDIAICGLLDAY
jgi:hypothetical protein